MERETLLQLTTEKQPDLSLLCHLAKKTPPTPSFISEIFLPFFKRLISYEYEIQIQLSEVYSIHGNKSENAYWLNNIKLIPIVAHHWLISQLMVIPQEAIQNNTTYDIKNALHHINCNTRQQLEELLQIITLQNNIYDNEILILLKNGIENSKLTYAVSEKILHYLLTSPDYEIVYATCDLIKKHPFIFSIIPEVSLRRVMLKGGLYEHLALQTLGTWGYNQIFEEVIQSESWQLESKKVILPFLQLSSSLMNTLTQYLTLHPTYSTDWLDCLLRGANQGIYIPKKRIVEITQHYFEFEFISAKELVQLVGEYKEELFKLSEENTNSDFKKRILLYEELNIPNARKRIVEHLKETENTDSTQLTILLDSIANLKITEAESYIFPFIQNHAKVCLDTLRYIGSTKTITHLKQLLEFDATVKQNIPSFEKEALTLLTDLVPDQDIIDYLQKHKLPHINLPNLYVALPVNESYLLQLLDEGTVEYAIEKLGDLGTLKALEPIIKKIGMIDSCYTNLEYVINSAWKASKKIVKRAYDQHKLIKNKNYPENSVNKTLTEVLLKQFETPLNDATSKLYLDYISEVIPSEFPLEKLSILANSTNPHIIKFYISYLGKINTNTAIIQLKQELKTTQNIYTLRQTILALTAIKNTSLESLVSPLLGHPNMNIKKTVATYLAENGTVKSVTAMSNLFLRNNNQGLRYELEKGLKNILEKAYYFFLFNECFNCEVPWQLQLLENTILNDDKIKEEHYIDFPILHKIAPLKKLAPNSKKDQELITEWKTIRSKTKKDLSQCKESEDLISKIEKIKQQAGTVFIKDLIATSFRKLKKTPLSKNFNTRLTTEETRIAIREDDTNLSLWDTLLVDSQNEHIEYDNIVVYKEYKKKEKLFFHFMSHYGLQKTVSKLLEKDQISFLKKILLSSQIDRPKYLSLFIELYSVLKKERNKDITSSLEILITKHTFTNKNHQTILFYLEATTDEKINKLRFYTSQQQSLLKDDIVQLYKNSSWKQRNTLLQTIKTPENHNVLFKLSFTDYLEGKELDYYIFDTNKIQQFEKHIDAFELRKQTPNSLKYHSNDFILAYVKEVTSDNEATPLLQSFRQFNTERKWEILKTELEQGNSYWFNFFDTFAPINSELKKYFNKASLQGKLELIKNLNDSKETLYFPQFEKELLIFLKKHNEPSAWELLFKLQLKNNEKDLTDEFKHEYTNYTTSSKVKLLRHLLHSISDTLVNSSIFNSLKPTDKEEELLLIQLQLKSLDYKSVDSTIIIDLIKQISNNDVNLAKETVAEVIELCTDIGVEKQMKILNGCYNITALNEIITTQIALIFSTELLALSFLTEDNKKQFHEQVEQLITTNNIEIDKKGLLKNLVEESSDETQNLLLNILSSRKKTELDTLCLRLLKKSTSKKVYLETCYTLLSSNKESLFQSIIRTLSFAKYSVAIPTFIKLLSHKTLSKDAHKGLLIIGKDAIPILTKEANKARPDKRKVLNNLLLEIESELVLYEEIKN